jgi:hypothetical protein
MDRRAAHVTASLSVAAGRLALTAGLALLLPGLHLAGILAAVTAGVFGVAAVYESLRAAATGRTDQVPPPLRSALVGLWVAVGAGYALRGLTGLALAVDLGQRPGLALAAVVTTWAVGIAFVTSRWALESMPFARLSGGRVSWHVSRAQAREHTLGLVRWLPGTVDRRDLPAGGGPEDWRPLHGRTPLYAPWNLASLVAGSAAALAGGLLTGATGPAWGAVLAGAGLVAGSAVVLTPRRRASATLLGGALMVGAHALAGTPRPLLAAVPWLAAMLAHCSFTSQRARDLGHPLHRLTDARRRLRRPAETALPVTAAAAAPSPAVRGSAS